MVSRHISWAIVGFLPRGALETKGIAVDSRYSALGNGARGALAIGVAVWIAVGILLGLPAERAHAQRPIMAQPPTYRTWNNKTGAYQDVNAITYSSFTDGYAGAKTVQGVPNSIFSYIVTSGETTNNGYAVIRSTVSLPPLAPGGPIRPLNLTVPAGTANTSLGGLIDAFGWGVANTVMNQCFSGGFAFNLQGSLQGARPAAGGAIVPAPTIVPYTFSSGANFNELSFGILQPTGNSSPAVATAGADFTQGWAFGSTNTAGAGMPANTFPIYRSFNNGRLTDPFVAGRDGYGVPNQVPTAGAPPAPNLQGGGFESPVYASADAPGPAGAVNEAAANNARTLAVNAANSWAVLLAMTPDRPEFSLDIQRQYAALLSNGVPRNHIAVLYGKGTEASLARFTNLTADNTRPNVNNILNTVAADFSVPVNGATTQANISGLLNPAIIQNPLAPAPMRVNFWQHLLGTGPAGPSPAAGNNLMLYVTGHGSAVNIFGGEITAINRADGNVFTTDIKLAAPDNVTVAPGMQLNAQITARSSLIDVATDSFLVNGIPLGPGMVGTLGVDAFDVSQAVDDSLTDPYYYYNVFIPTDYLYGPGYDGRFTFSISSPDFISDVMSIESITLMDDTPAACALGACNMYVDLLTGIAVPEPGSALLLAAGFASLVARRRSWGARSRFGVRRASAGLPQSC